MRRFLLTRDSFKKRFFQKSYLFKKYFFQKHFSKNLKPWVLQCLHMSLHAVGRSAQSLCSRRLGKKPMSHFVFPSLSWTPIIADTAAAVWINKFTVFFFLTEFLECSAHEPCCLGLLLMTLDAQMWFCVPTYQESLDLLSWLLKFSCCMYILGIVVCKSKHAKTLFYE